MSSQRVLVSALVLLLAMQAVIGQNYHFSNGWHSGKKRGGDINGCAFRRDVLMLVNKLVLEEASRVSQCMGLASNIEYAESDSLDRDADKRWK